MTTPNTQKKLAKIDLQDKPTTKNVTLGIYRGQLHMMPPRQSLQWCPCL